MITDAQMKELTRKCGKEMLNSGLECFISVINKSTGSSDIMFMSGGERASANLLLVAYNLGVIAKKLPPPDNIIVPVGLHLQIDNGIKNG